MRLRGALLAACLLAPGVAFAQPVAFSSPGAGESLRAGDQVEMRWTGVPSDAEEMELLLSLDGGRQIALRLTSEIPATDHSFVWTVPNLGSSQASLVLRIGSVGRERVVGASAPFAIIFDPSLDYETLSLRSGELWLSREAAASDPLPPAGVGPGERGWSDSASEEKAGFVSSSPVLPLPSRTRLFPGFRATARRARVLRDDVRIPPPPPPLRI